MKTDDAKITVRILSSIYLSLILTTSFANTSSFSTACLLGNQAKDR